MKLLLSGIFTPLFLLIKALDATNNSISLSSSTSVTPSLSSSGSISIALNSSPVWNTNGTNVSYILPSGVMLLMTSTISPQIGECYGKDRWRQDVFTDGKECLTNECMESFFGDLIQYMSCNSRAVSDELQLIGSRANEYALLVAEKEVQGIRIETTLTNVKNFKTKTKKFFTIQYGFVVKSFQQAHVALEFGLENNGRAKIKYPPGELATENNAFIYTEFNSVYSVGQEIKYYHTSTAIDDASAKLRSNRFTSDKKYFNSKIISFLTSPRQVRPGDYITITFQFNNYANLTLTNHLCVHIESLGAGYWTDGECHEHFFDKKEIICRCKALSGSYAVISELEKEAPKEAGIERTIISTLIMGVAVAGIVLMVISMIFPYVMKTAHLGGMLIIYRLYDLTIAVQCSVLLYGVAKSDDVERTPLIGATLHYFQAAIMVWTIVEGFFLYHGILPLFQNTTGFTFFFSTIAFGFAAATSGGAVGYPFGYTDKKEFIWPTAQSSDSIYLLIPSLLCLLVLVVFDVVLIYELLSWIGNKEDYSYARSVKFLKRANGYMFVFIVTQFFGISSQQTVSDGFYTYGFLAFFAIQIICIFYHHCFSNFEIWSYREEEEEMRKLELENDEVIEPETNVVPEKKNIDDLLLAAPIIEANLPEKHLADDGFDNDNFEEDDLDGRDGLDGHNSPPLTTDSQVPLIKSRPESATSNSLYGSKESLKSQERANDTIVDIPEDTRETDDVIGDDENADNDANKENNDGENAGNETSENDDGTDGNSHDNSDVADDKKEDSESKTEDGDSESKTEEKDDAPKNKNNEASHDNEVSQERNTDFV